ncbi:MAG: YbbR-like domain-containing protein [Bacteroidales bacterium]|nr:YbbR-like domain-containing protein [Bacteroidales bacterium]
MKTGLANNAGTNPNPAKTRFRNQFSIFFVFVVFSATVWVIAKLSKDFTSAITYNVEYENLPAGKTLVYASDTAITVGLDASGFNLINYHLFKKKPVVSIDLSGMRLYPDGINFYGLLLTSGLTGKLASQVGSHNELIFITPDTLRFEFKAEHSRRVPVLPRVQYQLSAQHMLYDSIQVVPDSIWVYGPHEIIDTLFFVETSLQTLNEINENLQLNLALQKKPDLPLTYSDNEVEVRINVEKFTEKSFDLPIIVNCPDSLFTLRVFPETVKVHCLVALKDYKRIDPALFEAAIFCSPGELQSSNKLRVEIRQHPSYVRIARIEPERVEYIMVKTLQ